MGSLFGRDLLTLGDFNHDELMNILKLAGSLKEQQKKGVPHHTLPGCTLGMIFQKSSTRTRVSFEVAMYQLGGYALFLSAQDLQIGRGEPVKDTARVLSRYVDGIMIRTFDHSEAEELAEYASIPVINGLTDLLHPCQALADFQTILERKGTLKGINLAYVGDSNNVANSLLLGGATLGVNLRIASPPGYKPGKEVLLEAEKRASLSGSSIHITENPKEAVKGADVVYTDVWTSMGQEKENEVRKEIFKSYQINNTLLEEAKPDSIVLHCLPAHREEEISEEVFEGPCSAVFDQAENRLHSQKAVLTLLMGNEEY